MIMKRSWPGERLLAPQEGLCSMQIVSFSHRFLSLGKQFWRPQLEGTGFCEKAKALDLLLLLLLLSLSVYLHRKWCWRSPPIH